MAAPSLEVQALLSSTTPGWNGQNGLPQVVTFSFAQDGLGTWGTNGGVATSWAPFNAAQQASARAALADWAAACGLVFLEVPDKPAGAGEDLRFRFEDLTGVGSATGGQAAGDAGYPRNGDIHIDLSGYGTASLARGTYGFAVLEHEIGHAIGLKHSFEGSTLLPLSEENRDFTVMSYTNGPGGFPTHLGSLDPAAVQYIYGTAADEANAGLASSYNAATGRVEIRIGAGTQAVRGVDFREEMFIGDGARTVTGGGGDTIIHGGAGGQTIKAGSGVNLVLGGSGNDVITDGQGFAGDQGARLFGGAGNDTITGGTGDDWIGGGPGNDSIDGGYADNTLYMATARRAATISKTAQFTTQAASDNHQLTQYRGTVTGPGEVDSFQKISNFAFIDGRITYDADDPAAKALRLYDAAFGRAPDAPGLHGWTVALQGGLALKSAASGFSGSAEFAARYGAPNDTGFVTLLYQNTLHRNPDTAGLNGWVSALANHTQDRNDVLLAFSESTEHRGLTAASVTAGIWDQDPVGASLARLYDTAFLRRPDLGGITGWKGATDAGTSLHDVAQGFLGSAEFAARYGSNVSNATFVTLFYTNALGRAPDAPGQAGWQNALDTGFIDRAGVLLGFADSAEHTARVAQYIDGGIIYA